MSAAWHKAGWGVLIVIELVLLAFATKLLVMVGGNDAGRSDYARSDLPGASSAFARNTTLNYFDSWVALFNSGVAEHRAAQWDRAIEDYRRALLVVPDEDRCLVVANLSAAYEQAANELAQQGNSASAAAMRERSAVAMRSSRCHPMSSTASSDANGQGQGQGHPGQHQQSPTRPHVPDLTKAQGSQADRERQLHRRQQAGQAARQQQQQGSRGQSGQQVQRPW